MRLYDIAVCALIATIGMFITDIIEKHLKKH
jgi:hypothetical protein